jgi:hypothetical protein
MSPARSFALLMLLAGPALTIGYAAASLRLADRLPVYSVAALRAHLDHDAHSWVGRTVLVRGTLEGCPYVRPGPCASWRPLLVDRSVDAGTSSGLSLQLRAQRADPLDTALRRVPLLRDLVAAPQVPHWGVTMTYRVQIREQTSRYCCVGGSYQVQLLDAAP